MESALNHLQDLQHKHLLVSTKTGALHEACEQLLQDQVREIVYLALDVGGNSPYCGYNNFLDVLDNFSYNYGNNYYCITNFSMHFKVSDEWLRFKQVTLHYVYDNKDKDGDSDGDGAYVLAPKR